MVKKIAIMAMIILLAISSVSCNRQAIIMAPVNSSIILVNKKYGLKRNYMPKDLKVPYIRFIETVDPNVKEMDATAANAIENLFNDAEAEGVILLGVSGYREFDYQEELYKSEVQLNGKTLADKYVAKAGNSEHQTGLAIDVLCEDYQVLDEGFADTTAYKWIEENSHKYGFIIRFPKGKEKITKYSYEPWHIRYVGVKEATEIKNRGITLEEYLNKKN